MNMKKWFVLTVLIAGIAVAQSEPRGVDSPQEKNVSVPVVHDARKPLSGTAKRTWGAKVLGVFPGKRDETERRRMEDDGPSVSERDSPQVTHIQPSTTPSESEYLGEIASVLSIPVSKDDTPGDIAFKIKQRIGHAERYRGEVLSDESFELAKSAIGIPADAETFTQYHKFIKKIEGKKVLILDYGEKRP